MKITFHEFIKKHNIPQTWLAEQCGFTRSQLGNWVATPEKTPIPADKKMIIQQKLKELSNVFGNIELL